MRLLLLISSLLMCAPVLAQSQAAASTRHRYELAATLDPVQHRVSGQARIHFVNHSRAPVAALYFHLYPNAFAHEHTVFMREGGGQIRGRRLERPGRMDVTGLRTADGADLLAGASFELIERDRTQLRVELPSPIEPGQALDLRVDFVTVLPEIVARAGVAGEFHMLGQWFPKLARLEDDGQFASFPYHGLGEFYADFADYVLRLRVPEGQVVAASGQRISSVRDAGFRSEVFVAERVHDMAAAVYPYFERHVRAADSVRIEVFAPRGYGAAARRQAETAAAGLQAFAQAYGPYPYPQLTIVLPPRGAEGASGMEYPTLFVSGGPWWSMPAGLADPIHDVVTAHELAHQWFSGMIATNEVESPMLDEGLTQWASLDFLRSRYRNLQRPPLEPFDLLEATFLFRGQPVPSSLLPAYRYRFDTLARAVYLRPALVLHEIERRHGRGPLRSALRRYAEQGRFQHPRLADFFRAFDVTFGAGFAERELKPALAGERDAAPSGPVRPRAEWFLGDLIFAAQALLHAIGP